MRCYDGAWDSEATALFARQDKLMSQIREIEPEAHCTYFPHDSLFQVHVWGRPLTGMCASRVAALESALEKLP